MTPIALQEWLGAHGQPVALDGKIGPASRAAIIVAFTNKRAAAVTDVEIAALAERLDCSTKQLRAVSIVESSGNGFDAAGRPKILFERHKFHAFTGGRYSPAGYSDPKAGGYGELSWEKLTQAASRDADAAFKSTSWGKFQVMGWHWEALRYASPIDMAYSTVTSEADHYDMLARFIEANRLQDELRAISRDPDTCRAFAKAYNGSGYERFFYHLKLAEQMR